MAPEICLVCPTANRPAGLRRGLQSYLANAARHRRQVRVIVADNSDTVEMRRTNRELLSDLARSSGALIQHIGLEQKIELMTAMVRDGADPNVLRFALRGVVHPSLPPIGANYNALLLASSGHRCISVDDDTICETAVPAATPLESDASDAAYSSSYPYDLWPCASLEDAASRVNAVERDFIGEHIAHLGAEDGDGRPDVRRGLVTLNGVYGDSGWASPTFYLLLTGAALRRLISNGSDAYHRACSSRFVVKATAPVVRLPHTDNMMCMTFGFDHGQFMVPFLPVGRGCDHLWGVVTGTCAPQGPITYVPVLIKHAPLENRRFWVNETSRSASGVDLGFVVGCLVRASLEGCTLDGARARAAAAGRALEEIALSDGAEFRQRVLEMLRPRVESYIDALARRCAAATSDVQFWVADVHRVIAIQQRALMSDRYVLPLDLLLGQDVGSATAMLRRVVSAYGRLLSHWSELVAVAEDVRRRCGEIGLLAPYGATKPRVSTLP